MNAERLHTLSIVVLKELDSQEFVETWQALQDRMSEVTNSPDELEFQKEFNRTRDNLFKILDASETNRLSPIWEKSLEESDIFQFVGKGLKKKIQTTLQQANLTPALVHQELHEVNAKIQEIKTSLQNVQNGFQLLKIEPEEIKHDTAEMELLVPREFVQHTLSGLGKEAQELNKILRPFEEAATGASPSDLRVKSISSSDFIIYLEVAITTATLLATVLPPLIQKYKKYLEFKSKEESRLAKEYGFRQEDFEGFKKRIRKEIDEYMEMKSEWMAKESKLKDNRKNELKISLNRSLESMAERIDNGFSIHISISPPEKKDPLKNEKLELIKSLEDFRFIRPPGDPILKLPPQTEKKMNPDKEEEEKKRLEFFKAPKNRNPQ